MKIVMISDTHAKWQKLQIPECDILISAGDYSFRGEKHLVKNFHEWMSKQPARHVISVQGNHETWVEKNLEEARELVFKNSPRVKFVVEESFEIEGIKFHGSAITPWFYNWAWNVERGPAIKAHWDKIPDDTQVLITHGPPAGILDIVYYPDGVTPRERVGCHDLMDRIKQLKNLKLHVFGHIHCDAGEKNFNGVQFVNAAICDEQYMPTQPIREFYL